MANDNVRDMEESLKDDIRRFFKREYEGRIGFANDFADELEAFLKQEGWDLGCVCQYRKKT